LINDAIPFLTDISSGKFGRFRPRRVWLLTHIAGSALALLVGPFQLWPGLRQHSMLVSRVLLPKSYCLARKRAW
jgi:hypothetical protein